MSLRAGVLVLLLAGLCLLGCRSGPSASVLAPRQDLPVATLPPPEKRAVPDPPADEPIPPAVGKTEALRQVARVLPRTLRVLKTAGGVPLLLWDLDGDAQPECLVVAGPSRGLTDEEFRQLANPSRLFEEGAGPVAFHLGVFTTRGGTLELLQVLALGEHLAFEALRLAPLRSEHELPVIVTASFLAPEGKELEVLVFDDGSGAPRYRRSLTETLSTGLRLEDIDADGILDMLVSERAMEEGTGYETFLTWYRWNGRSFREYRTTNVVRNLNRFLTDLQEQLLNHRVTEVVGRALHPREQARLRRQGLGPEAMLLKTLGLEPTGLAALPAIREIIFPPILENPFTSTDPVGSYFELSFRIVDLGGGSFIARTRVYLLLNPFGDRQFALVAPLD